MDDAEIVRHDVQLGLVRLHHQPKDVRDPINSYYRVPARLDCAPALRPLHLLYLDDACWAADQAVEWWSSLVETHMEVHPDVRSAALATYGRWPAGPGANEYMVSTVRRYWLACVEECRRLPPEEAMLPEDFLLATLNPERDRRLVLVLTSMPYWPVGLDAQGNWC